MIGPPLSPEELVELNRRARELPWKRSVSRSKSPAKAYLRGNYLPEQEYVREKDIPRDLFWLMAHRCPGWKADGLFYQLRLHGGILRRYPESEVNRKIVEESRRRTH